MVCKSPLLRAQNVKDGKVFDKQVASVRKTFFEETRVVQVFSNFSLLWNPKIHYYV